VSNDLAAYLLEIQSVTLDECNSKLAKDEAKQEGSKWSDSNDLSRTRMINTIIISN
jgi:hypothetical protein